MQKTGFLITRLKWYLEAHEQSTVLKEFKVLCDFTDTDNNFNQNHAANVITQDQNDVKRISYI